MKHGGDLAQAIALYGRPEPPAEPWLDLSTGINPHSWPVPEALREAGWTRLPSRADGEALVEAARAAYGAGARARIIAAPGTQSIIQWLPRLAPPGRVAVASPTYGEHEASWRAAGFEVETSGSPDWPAGNVRHVIVVNPNNPDGRIIALPRLREIGHRCAARGGWLVIDESFADIAPECSMAGEAAEAPVVVLRSFGKFFGLAGLRLGFAITSPPIADALERALGPWCVSGPAIAVGTCALADRTWASRTRLRLAAEARELDRVLESAGLAIAGGTDLFRLAGATDAGRLHDGLARRAIWTRRFPWSAGLLRFGLPPDEAASARLARALFGMSG